jgi:flagellar hook-length control protein FliK
MGREACESTSKGGRQVFADAAPLARLRDELRSNKRQCQGAEGACSADGAQVADPDTDSVESPVASDGRGLKSDDPIADPPEEQAVSLPADSPVHEIAPLPAQGETVDVAGPDVGSQVPRGEPHQSMRMVSQTMSAEGQVSQMQVRAAAETGDAKGLAVQPDVPASGRHNGVEVAETVVTRGEVTADGRDGAALSATAAPGAEGPKQVVAEVVPAGGQGRADTPRGGEAKTSVADAEAADTSRAAPIQAPTGLQSPEQLKNQPAREAAKDFDPGHAATTSRASQTSEGSADGTRQENGQPFSRQDSHLRQVGAAVGVGKESPVPDAKGPLLSPIEVTASTESDPASAFVRLSAQAPSTTGADAASLRSPVQDVGEQILSSIHASIARADKQVQIRLDPPELGSVLVRVHEQGNQIRGTIEVIYDETRREIERALPEVLSRLQEAGVGVRRVEVVVSDQPDRGLGREHFQQDAWTQQRESGWQGYRPQDASSDFGGPRADLGAAHGGPSSVGNPQSAIGNGLDGRIDMLV